MQNKSTGITEEPLSGQHKGIIQIGISVYHILLIH
jgi:hypothetical protein